jgi:hypothetical protein
MKKKMCSNQPIIFTQAAINVLFNWFPDSRGNLEADEVMDTIIGHYGDETGTPQGLNDATNEVYEKTMMLINSGKTSFSPVI